MIRRKSAAALSLTAIFILTSIIVYENFTKASAQDTYQETTSHIFLKIDTIDGESQDDTHRDWIEIEAYDWGENQTSLGAAGMSAGLVKMQNFHFTARFSKASPKLFLACANGRIIRYAVLAIQTWTADAPADYLKWYFMDVTITSYATAANIHGEPTPVDQFSIAFGKIGVEYRQILPDGSLDAPIKEGWDLRANRPWTPTAPSP